MAEAPWTCRRIPILTYYGEQPDPGFICDNCDICFAADSQLADTTSIKKDVECIQRLFEGRQFAPLCRTELHKSLRYSQHGKRVVEYLVFKGILKETPYVNKYVLHCRLMMVGSKIFHVVKPFTNDKPNCRFLDSHSPPPCLLSVLRGFQNFHGSGSVDNFPPNPA